MENKFLLFSLRCEDLFLFFFLINAFWQICFKRKKNWYFLVIQFFMTFLIAWLYLISLVTNVAHVVCFKAAALSALFCSWWWVSRKHPRHSRVQQGIPTAPTPFWPRAWLSQQGKVGEYMLLAHFCCMWKLGIVCCMGCYETIRTMLSLMLEKLSL